jgi:WhiB family redox-sensing transcriptional regulator
MKSAPSNHTVSLAWADRARCRDADPRQFYAPYGEDAIGRRTREDAVKARYCDDCEVRTQCRDRARQHREYGLWGGESEDERADAGYAPVLWRRRRAADAN